MAEYGRRRNENDCCSCCCGFIITSGLTALFMWLSLRTSRPTCSIQDFYVPALNTTANNNNNRTIYFDLKLDNRMKDKGVHYANISLAFFYNNATTAHIANYTVPAFYQGHNKKARRKDLVNATAGVPWAAALAAVSNGSTVSFRVKLATRVKYKILFWYTKRQTLAVNAAVEVNGSGKKVKKKGIKLTSGALGPGPGLARAGAAPACFALLIILFW